MWETRVWFLGWEDPPEKGMATHSSVLARRIPWTEEPGELQSMEVPKGWTQLSTYAHTHTDTKIKFYTTVEKLENSGKYKGKQNLE